MGYSLTGHRVEKGRLVLEIKVKRFFGLYQKDIECMETGKWYVHFNQPSWVYKDTFNKVSWSTKLQDFCCKMADKITFEKKS